MQFLMKQLDKLVGKGIDNIVIVQLITYNIAWMVILAIPMGVLFASLVAFGNMSANHEITILKASGGSLIRMMCPLLLVSVFVSYALFLYNSELVPETNHLAKVLLYDVQRKKPALAVEAGQFCNEIEGYTILAREIDTTDNTLQGVTIYDTKNRLTNRTINAERCNIAFSPDMTKLVFHLQNGEMHQSANGKVNNYRYAKFVDYTIMTNTNGFGFERSEDGSVSRGDRELFNWEMEERIAGCDSNIARERQNMDTLLNANLAYLISGTHFNMPQFIFRLQNTYNNIENNIERANSYKVEIHKKYSIPFACVVFVLIGCPLGVITKGGNFGISAAITLMFYILYWACLIAGEKLADRNLVDPVLSMWFGNIVIGIVGIIITLKANNENLSFSPSKLFRRQIGTTTI
jgi:lipopolysaccharide export system permease protein